MLGPSEARTPTFATETSNTLIPKRVKNVTREWVPTSLRKSRAIPLAIFCWVFAVCLEILDLTVRWNHGIPADHASAYRAARYLPTIGVVALGFAWKALVSDIKNVIPWSQMTGRWAKGSHSMLLDYITNIEITSLFRSIGNGHWLVFLALSIGFLCGASVALANSLLFLDMFASTTTDTTLAKVSQFSFDHTLELSNGTLPIPFDHLGAKPYAAVASERLPNGQFAPWTMDRFAFESFQGTSDNVPSNATIEASVRAFSTDFNCHPLKYSWKDDYIHQLEANAGGIPGLNCSLPIRQNFTTESDAPLRTNTKAWLNVTSCTPNTTENLLIGTVASLEESRDCAGRSSCSPGDVFYNITNALGFVCSPKFFLQDATARANASTGHIISYQQTEPRSQIDIRASASGLWLYLSNPLDAKLQTIFSNTNLRFPTLSPPVAVGFEIITAVEAMSQSNITIDPFFTLLINGQQESSVEPYLQDQDRLLQDSETLGSNVLAQVVNSFARYNTSSDVPGSSSTAGPRYFVNQPSLRALQVILILVGCASVMYATFIRPKSMLQVDPGSLAASAVILSHSGSEVEKVLAREATSTDQKMQQTLGSTTWQLQPHKSGMALTLQYQPLQPEEKGDQRNSLDLLDHPGWRPMALYVSSKVALIIVLIVIMVAFAVLLHVSQSNNGICQDTSISFYAFQLVPTSILVLIGYACSGVDGAVRTTSSYKTLWNMSDPQKRNSEKQPLLQNLRDVPNFMVPIRASKASAYGISVTASSIAILLIPVIKIVAAGLYGVALSTTTRQVQSLVDTSIVTHLESTYGLGDSYLNVQRASQFAEWSRTPSLNVPRRAGILDNLVFSNITEVEDLDGNLDLSNSIIDLEVPAISVDVNCTNAYMGLDTTYLDSQDCWTFTTKCETEECKTLIPSGSNDDPAASQISGSGGSCTGADARYAGTTIFGPSDYRVILADWSTIKDPFTNTTPWGKTKDYDDYNLTSGFMTPSVLNVSLPTVRAVSCSLALHHLTVNTTYAFSPSDRTWNPTAFDPTTLTRRSTFNATALPSFLRPYATSANGTALLDFADITTNRPGRLQSASLWPTRGSPLNFFELLAAHAEYDLGNLSALLDAERFAPAVETMFTAYTAEMLTELRSAAAAAAKTPARNAEPGKAPARLVFRQSRVVQDRGSTVALEALLGVVAACFAWVFVRFPSRALLPKSPGSVAARMALVAGSGLVGRLREGGVRAVGDVNGKAEGAWRGRAGLGWWEERGAREHGERRMRWGIDVGEGVVRGSWNCPPKGLVPVEVEMGPMASGRSSASLMARRGEVVEAGEEAGPALSRRSSVSSMSRRSSSGSSGVTIISE